MENNKNASTGEPTQNHLGTPGQGPEGVDKALGEETSEDNVQFVQETQKGKKVDADVTKENERPIEQDLP